MRDDGSRGYDCFRKHESTRKDGDDLSDDADAD
jgi:hypothetical protein